MTIVHTSPQGSEQWLADRRGCITGSRFKDCRDKLKSGAPSKACLTYAQDVARERIGGSVLQTFATAAMRLGSDQEPIARMHYEMATDELVEEAGFITTDDRKFGVSVDGLIGADGLYECKTMVSSATLFTALVEGDISEYIDQCEGEMWLLGRKWVDLHLWVADLPHLSKVIRIERDDERINALEADLIAFERLVSKYEAQLRALAGDTAPPAPPWDSPAVAAPQASAKAPAALPENLFA